MRAALEVMTTNWKTKAEMKRPCAGLSLEGGDETTLRWMIDTCLAGLANTLGTTCLTEA